MRAFKYILFHLLFSTSIQATMASNMANNDSDELLVAIEIDFTFVGRTRTWPVGKDLDLLSSPHTPKESKEEQRNRKKESLPQPKNVEVETCGHLFHDLTFKMLTS
jgi:hypothetical protein